MSSAVCLSSSGFLVVLVCIRVATPLVIHIVQYGTEHIGGLETFDRLLEKLARSLPGTNHKQNLVAQAGKNVAVGYRQHGRCIHDDVGVLLLQSLEESSRSRRGQGGNRIRLRHASRYDREAFIL